MKNIRSGHFDKLNFEGLRRLSPNFCWNFRDFRNLLTTLSSLKYLDFKSISSNKNARRRCEEYEIKMLLRENWEESRINLNTSVNVT
jgi:hypothetical protein